MTEQGDGLPPQDGAGGAAMRLGTLECADAEVVCKPAPRVHSFPTQYLDLAKDCSPLLRRSFSLLLGDRHALGDEQGIQAALLGQ